MTNEIVVLAESIIEFDHPREQYREKMEALEQLALTIETERNKRSRVPIRIKLAAQDGEERSLTLFQLAQLPMAQRYELNQPLHAVQGCARFEIVSMSLMKCSELCCLDERGLQLVAKIAKCCVSIPDILHFQPNDEMHTRQEKEKQVRYLVGALQAVLVGGILSGVQLNGTIQRLTFNEIASKPFLPAFFSSAQVCTTLKVVELVQADEWRHFSKGELDMWRWWPTRSSASAQETTSKSWRSI